MPTRVLVIEDNAANLALLLYLLKAHGYEAEGANDGIAGFDAASKGNFDLVLTDILMPGIDGYELAARFKGDARLRETPLVAVTALAMVGDRERIIGAGFEGYMSKPIEPETFIAKVAAFLEPRKESESGDGPGR